MCECWQASLNPLSANYEHWFQIFGGAPIPLLSDEPIRVDLGAEKSVACYELNLDAMTLRQRAKLLGMLAARFKQKIANVEAEIAQNGCPIRVADVIVRFEKRAVV